MDLSSIKSRVMMTNDVMLITCVNVIWHQGSRQLLHTSAHDKFILISKRRDYVYDLKEII